MLMVMVVIVINGYDNASKGCPREPTEEVTMMVMVIVMLMVMVMIVILTTVVEEVARL